MTVDLAALVNERMAAKIAEGKRPSKADAEWYQLLTESVPHSSVDKSRNAKGDTQITVKTYHRDPLEAERINDLIFDRQRARYPMADGTVGAPIHEQTP